MTGHESDNRFVTVKFRENMPRTRRSFTPEERLSLIQEVEREGYMETCREYSLSPTLLSRWKQKYQAKELKA